MRKVNFLSLDLELNTPPPKLRNGVDTPPPIIQVGAVIGNLETGKILHRFSEFVNPESTLYPEITKLTKIKQEDVDNAHTLDVVYWLLAQEHLRYDCFINCITWGGGDTEALRKEMKLPIEDERWKFGRRWIDAKTLYVSYRWANNKDMAGGLAKALTHLGLKFEGRRHNAVDDAYNTFEIYRCLLKFFGAPFFEPQGWKEISG
jgi:inhibitor of KinA sporulation pathway (predicted exonuclease)